MGAMDMRVKHKWYEWFGVLVGAALAVLNIWSVSVAVMEERWALVPFGIFGLAVSAWIIWMWLIDLPRKRVQNERVRAEIEARIKAIRDQYL